MPRLFPKLFLLLLSFSLACVPAAKATESSRESLQNEIDSLRQQLALKEAQLQALTRTSGNTEIASSALALAATPATPRVAPGSSLAWEKALRAASAARYMVSGASLMTVQPTGSMKPLFDERAVLVMEPAPFEQLKVGDIVTYRHPGHAMPVVHRILEKQGDHFLTKGDNNDRVDEVLITRENYQARVFGIIYANEAPKP